MQSKKTLQIAWSIPVRIFAALALLCGMFYWLMTLLFLGNFSLGSLWHLFVLAYTITIPFLTIGGLVIFMLKPGKTSGIASLILSTASFFTFLLWTSEQSRGLVH